MVGIRLLLASVGLLATEAFIQNPVSAIRAREPISAGLGNGRLQLRVPGYPGRISMSQDKGGHQLFSAKLGRRDLISILPAMFTLAPLVVNAQSPQAPLDTSAKSAQETAAMGADTLDRPEFRRYHDLTKDEVYVPGADGSAVLKDIPVPINGRQKKLGKLLGTGATVVMNVKLDDPETMTQIPSLRSVMTQFADKGLKAICFPTDQGDYEPDDSFTVRIKVRHAPREIQPPCQITL